MLRAEVETILGGPPGNYRSNNQVALFIGVAHGEQWVGDDVEIRVAFDEHDKVWGKCGSALFPPAQTFVERLRGWLRL